MAKDGTNRGGARVGAGRKKKPLSQKIAEGQRAVAIPEPADLQGVEMPAVKDYLSREQRIGTLYGKEIYEEVWKWLAERKCAHLVSPQLLEQYSMTMGRYIQLEEMISEYGFISKHPTTGMAITSPFVATALNYIHRANLIWQQIYGIVQENSREPVTDNPQNDMMERLLGM